MSPIGGSPARLSLQLPASPMASALHLMMIFTAAQYAALGKSQVITPEVEFLCVYVRARSKREAESLVIKRKHTWCIGRSQPWLLQQ